MLYSISGWTKAQLLEYCRVENVAITRLLHHLGKFSPSDIEEFFSEQPEKLEIPWLVKIPTYNPSQRDALWYEVTQYPGCAITELPDMDDLDEDPECESVDEMRFPRGRSGLDENANHLCGAELIYYKMQHNDDDVTNVFSADFSEEEFDAFMKECVATGWNAMFDKEGNLNLTAKLGPIRDMYSWTGIEYYGSGHAVFWIGCAQCDLSQEGREIAITDLVADLLEVKANVHLFRNEDAKLEFKNLFKEFIAGNGEMYIELEPETQQRLTEILADI